MIKSAQHGLPIVLMLFVTVVAFAQTTESRQQFAPSSQLTSIIVDWKYNFGDEPQWALPAYDDQQWPKVNPKSFPDDSTAIRWYRSAINITTLPRKDDFITLHLVGFLSAYQVFWDGKLLGHNGQIERAKKRESPGVFRKIIKLNPADVQTGIHTIAIRLSNVTNSGQKSLPMAIIGYHDHLESRKMQFYLFQAINGSLFLFTSVFCIAMFWGSGRHRRYLLFALYCLTVLLDIVVSSIINFHALNLYYLQFWRIFYNIITPLSGILIILFLIYNFEIPRKRFHIILFSLSIVLTTVIWGRHHAVFLSVYGIGLLIYAVYRKKTGATVALVGYLVSDILLLMYFFGYVYYFYAVGLTFFVFCMMLSISAQIRQASRNHQQALLRSARLESELLKKYIQPHFLMNTLLSIISWLEKQPGRAKSMIEALAEEFRVVNQVSGEKLIPIEEEIKLCRTHLNLMGNRKNAVYQLKTTGLPKNAMIPPMVFHTLIENGLTHSYLPEEDGCFELIFSRRNNKNFYRLRNNGSLLKKLSQKSAAELEEGLGLKYIKARLTESFADKWSLSYGLVDQHWTVDIIIEDKG